MALSLRIRSNAGRIISAAAGCGTTAAASSGPGCSLTGLIRGSSSEDTRKIKEKMFEDNQATSLLSTERKPVMTWAASSESPELEGWKRFNVDKDVSDEEFFDELKQRFLWFKKNKYLKEAEHYQNLAKVQSPKFMVIACVDSRVCPSNILGFQPGEAFMMRSVANLVPPNEFGTSETGAALEFAVKVLQVKNILVIGHSCCAGIESLMNMKNVDPRSYIDKWVINGKPAKLRTKAVASHLNFQEQCKHCEKASIDESLRNLLTYPWIEERFGKGLISLNGGYYDFVKCTFEKWRLDVDGSSCSDRGKGLSMKDHVIWH